MERMSERRLGETVREFVTQSAVERRLNLDKRYDGKSVAVLHEHTATRMN